MSPLTAPLAPPAGLVGASVARPEDVPLVKGEAVFVGDVDRPGQLHARVVRSQVAHGRLEGVDVDGALAHPGVVAVFTGRDLPDVRIPVRMPWGDVDAQRRALQPPLARDRVRYVGEPVAVVVARDQASAEDAAVEVFADIVDEPVVVDADAAAEPGAPLLHAGLDSNVVDTLHWHHGGDVDALFAGADLVVRERLHVQRHTGVPLETRGLVAELSPATGRLTVWGAAKVKFFNRSALAALLEMDEAAINLVENEVGGGFGVRGELYPEDFLIPWLAIRLGRPVKWIEDRAEHLVATNHSREQDHVLEIAATSDGKLLAFRDVARVNMGGYVRTHGAMVPVSTAWHLPGPYVWQGFEVAQQLVLTNKTPAGTYRGPGGVEACTVRERLLDRVAGRLGLDPAELRRRNIVTTDVMPHPVDFTVGPGPYVHDAGDYLHVWDDLIEQVGYEELRASTRARRAAGELVGVGVAAFVELAVIGPFETARITARPDGRYEVALGVASVGQGLRTALGQIAADALDVPFDAIDVVYHSTDTTPFGFGAFASRVTVVAGNAVAVAAEALRGKARTAAAARLGVGEADLELDRGVARAPDGREIAFRELDLVAEGRFDQDALNVGFGGAVAVVSVDGGTGMVTIERLMVSVDIGKAVNPRLVHGQLVGAAAQGVGGALLEELVYDEYGTPLSTTFADYLLPTATDVPHIEAIAVEFPLTSNPLGIGPAGEGGIYAVPPAIANAVADAVGDPGDVLLRLPLTPERVWTAVRAARDAEAA